MATATYEPIATTTLGSAADTVTFSGIAATWTDLRLVIVAQSDYTSGHGFTVRANSDTGTNYSYTMLRGTGSAAQSISGTSTDSFSTASIPSYTTGYFSLHEFDFPSYAGSTYKTVLYTGSNDQNGSGQIQKLVQMWRSTSAITSLTISTALFAGRKFNTGSTFTLYGIKAA